MSPTTRFGTSTTPAQDPLKKGFFTKGQWHCNCQPRLPAVQFQVRRESKNKGRWFYTCQKNRTRGAPGAPDKCDFFLWAEDARLREEGALLGRRPRGAAERTPTQKRMRQTTLAASVTPRAAAERRAGPTPVVPLAELEGQVGSPATSIATLRAGDAARTQSSTLQAGDVAKTQSSTLREIDVETDSESSDDDTSEDELAPGPAAAPPPRSSGGPPQAGDKRKREDEEDDYGDWSSDEEQQLAAITDSSSRGPGAQGRKRDAFATPSAATRTHDAVAGLPTPSFTDRPLRRVLFADPKVPTPPAQRPRATASADTASSSPPTALEAQPPSVATTPGGPGLTAVVMGLLRDQKVDGAVRARVRQELERSEARAAQLQQRVVALDNERHLHAEARDNLRTGLMKLYSEN